LDTNYAALRLRRITSTLCAKYWIMNNIDFPSLASGATSLKHLVLDARGKGYLKSYPIYLEFFQASEVRDRDDFTVRAGLVYSWMPRVLVLSEQDVDDALEKILHFKESNSSSEIDELIDSVTKAFNGSYIGASKFLHFQYPKRFPIYDTKVYKKINGIKDDKKNVYAGANKAGCYKDYRESVNSTISHENFTKRVYDPVNEYMSEYGYKVSKVRAVEFVIFSNYSLTSA